MRDDVAADRDAVKPCARGPHGTVAVTVCPGAALVGGPAHSRSLSEFGFDKPHVLAPGSSGVLIALGDRVLHYHPVPCSDGRTADWMAFTHEHLPGDRA